MTKKILVFVLALVLALSCTAMLTACSQEVTYTVTFDVDGGSAVDAQTVVEGGTATKPTDPTKDGYTFAGWVGTDGEAFDFSSVITADTTVKATWADITYTVTVDGVAQTVVNGDKAVEPTIPTKDGHVFAGWVSGDDVFSFDTAITADTTVTATWSEAVVVTFVNNGVTTEVATAKGEVMNADSIPSTELAGYQFDGWYKDGVAGVFVDLSTLEITEDTTYVAFYSAVCTMSFVTGVDGVVVEDITALYNDKFVKPTNPEAEGLTFAGWYTDSELTEQYLFGSWAKGDMTVYAKWVYTVTLDHNNFTFETTTMWSSAVSEAGDNAIVNIYSNYISGIEYNNYEIKGFYMYNASGTKLTVTPGKSVIDSHATVYIEWDIPEVVTMTFDTGIEGVTVEAITADYNDKFVAPTNPEADGLKFAGWYTDESLSTQYSFGDWAKYNLTVYAKWVYTVTLDYNNGTGDSYPLWSSAVGAVGDEATCTIYSNYLTGIATFGRTIEGFYTGNDVEFISGKTVITEATTVYVKWSDTAKYTVSDEGVLTKVVLGSETDIVIPSTVDGVTVTSIAGMAISMIGVTTVTVPSTVTSVATNGIFFNSSLTSIVFEGAGLTTLAKNALFNNAVLETVYIPSSIESMDTTLGTTTNTLVYLGCDMDTAEELGFVKVLKLCSSNIVYNATSIDDIIVTYQTGNLSTPHLEAVVAGGTAVFYNGDIATQHAVAWYTDAALTEKFDFATAITENVTLYGQYEDGAVDGNYTTAIVE